MAGIERFHESEGPVVERDPEDRHIVGVHHTVAKSHRLPLCNEARGALDHFDQKLFVGAGYAGELWKIFLDHVIRELLQVLMFAPVVEHFERTEAHVRRGEAQQHRGGFRRFAIHGFVGAGDAERTRGGYAQCMHRFRAQILAYGRAQYCTSVGGARERRLARALELQRPAFAFGVDDFAQQNRAPVAQLRHEAAELMTGVEHRQRLRARRHEIAGEQIQKTFAAGFGGVEVEQRRGIVADADQIGRGKRRWVKSAIKRRRQARVAVVKRQGGDVAQLGLHDGDYRRAGSLWPRCRNFIRRWERGPISACPSWCMHSARRTWRSGFLC